MFALQSTTDLLKTPGPPQQHRHLLPGCQGKARAPFGGLPGLGQAMGLVRPLAPAAPVPAEFSTDRGLMHSHDRGNVNLGVPRFQ